MEIHKRRLLAQCSLYLLIMFMLVPALPAAALDAPPAWSAGQWWVVESQTYNLGKLRRGDTPHWEPKVRWRFQVEGTENLDGVPCYVVAVKPLEGNKASSSFRFWFRESDRSILRRDLIRAENLKDVGPPVATAAFNNPLSKYEFPALPVTIPAFGSNQAPAAAAGPAAQFARTQTAAKINAADLKAKADPGFMAKAGPNVGADNSLVKINHGKNITESQYWNNGLPWCVYGEQFDKTYTSRRYWLVDMGTN